MIPLNVSVIVATELSVAVLSKDKLIFFVHALYYGPPERANHLVGPFSLNARQTPLHGVQPVLVLTLGSAGRPALAKANAPAQENPFQESYLFNHSRRSESGNIM
jgi:hypothetical protein